ncbi:hypothetical protein ACLKMH_06405 [Psychromonas sp. KJ10-10]|uniref:hypothetical protein n=1 Tax=Psychromonas sp. KJ10-10 TaxID=3391823 RepID=UPI0039B49FB0
MQTNNQQLDEAHQTFNQGIELEEKVEFVDASSISNEVLSSNVADISVEKDAKQTKEQNTTDFSKEASQADSQLLEQSETAISDALAVNTKTQTSENSEGSLEETELVEGTPKTDLQLAKDIPSEIEDPSHTSGKKNISDIDVSPIATANKQVVEESIEIDASAENSESDKQNLTKLSAQANQLENNILNENKTIDANENEAEVLSTDSVNKLSNEQTEEQPPETMAGSVSTSNVQTRVVNENSEQLDEQAP